MFSSKTLLIILGLVYLLFPRDVIPDFAGVIGRIDDLIVCLLLYYQWRKQKRKPAQSQEQQSSQSEPKKRQRTPFEVLEVPENASFDQVKHSFKALAAQYHPDKVAHLGPELRELSHRKMVEIQAAYHELEKRFGER